MSKNCSKGEVPVKCHFKKNVGNLASYSKHFFKLQNCLVKYYLRLGALLHIINNAFSICFSDSLQVSLAISHSKNQLQSSLKVHYLVL